MTTMSKVTDGLSRPYLAGIYASGGILALGYGSVFSLLASLQDRDDLPTWGLGAIIGSTYLASVLVQITLARFADRGKSAQMIRAGALIGGVAMVWFGLSTSLGALIASRALLGLGQGIYLPAARRLVSEGEKSTGRSLGRLTAVYAFGFVLGPAVSAGLNSALGIEAAFMLPGVALVLVGAFLSRQPQDAASNVDIGRPPKAVGIATRVRGSEVQAVLAMAASYFWAIGTFDSLWARFLTDNGASTDLIGVALLVSAAPLVILPGLTGGWVERTGARRVGLAAQMMTAGVIILYPLAHEPYLICAIALAEMTLDAFVGPASQIWMAGVSGPDQFAAGQGLLGAVGMGSAGIAALVSAAIYGALGPEGAWWTSAGVVVGLAAFASLRGRRTIRRHKP